MPSYEEAKSIAIENTIPGGHVYCSGEAETLYYFIILKKDLSNVPGLMTGSTYTAVDKKDGKVSTISVTDPRLKGAKKIEGPKEKS